MPSRRDFDAPAATIAAILGLVVIGVSAPFTVLAYNDLASASKDFTATWAEKAGAPTETTTASATVHVAGVLEATVMVKVNSCTDNRGPNNIYPAATLTGKLTDPKGRVVFNGPIACTAGATAYKNTTTHPDVGKVTASDAGGALMAFNNTVEKSRVTGDYKLEITASRPASNPPIPPQFPVQPSISYAIDLSVGQWQASLTEATGAGK